MFISDTGDFHSITDGDVTLNFTGLLDSGFDRCVSKH